jgi:hypothetical protein
MTADLDYQAQLADLGRLARGLHLGVLAGAARPLVPPLAAEAAARRGAQERRQAGAAAEQAAAAAAGAAAEAQAAQAAQAAVGGYALAAVQALGRAVAGVLPGVQLPEPPLLQLLQGSLQQLQQRQAAGQEVQTGAECGGLFQALLLGALQAISGQGAVLQPSHVHGISATVSHHVTAAVGAALAVLPRQRAAQQAVARHGAAQQQAAQARVQRELGHEPAEQAQQAAPGAADVAAALEVPEWAEVLLREQVLAAAGAAGGAAGGAALCPARAAEAAFLAYLEHLLRNPHADWEADVLAPLDLALQEPALAAGPGAGEGGEGGAAPEQQGQQGQGGQQRQGGQGPPLPPRQLACEPLLRALASAHISVLLHQGGVEQLLAAALRLRRRYKSLRLVSGAGLKQLGGQLVAALGELAQGAAARAAAKVAPWQATTLPAAAAAMQQQDQQRQEGGAAAQAQAAAEPPGADAGQLCRPPCSPSPAKPAAPALPGAAAATSPPPSEEHGAAQQQGQQQQGQQGHSTRRAMAAAAAAAAGGEQAQAPGGRGGRSGSGADAAAGGYSFEAPLLLPTADARDAALQLLRLLADLVKSGYVGLAAAPAQQQAAQRQLHQVGGWQPG